MRRRKINNFILEMSDNIKKMRIFATKYVRKSDILTERCHKVDSAWRVRRGVCSKKL